jgi:hypothetical protein
MQAPVMSAATGRRLVVRDALELNLNCCQQANALIELSELIYVFGKLP